MHNVYVAAKYGRTFWFHNCPSYKHLRVRSPVLTQLRKLYRSSIAIHFDLTIQQPNSFQEGRFIGKASTQLAHTQCSTQSSALLSRAEPELLSELEEKSLLHLEYNVWLVVSGVTQCCFFGPNQTFFKCLIL